MAMHKGIGEKSWTVSTKVANSTITWLCGKISQNILITYWFQEFSKMVN